jgi:hypothetical protein
MIHSQQLPAEKSVWWKSAANQMKKTREGVKSALTLVGRRHRGGARPDTASAREPDERLYFQRPNSVTFA